MKKMFNIGTKNVIVITRGEIALTIGGNDG